MAEQTRSSHENALLNPGGDPNDVWSSGYSVGLAVVSSGLHSERLPVAGMTVAEIRQSFADRLDIDPNATPVLDGHRVANEHTPVGVEQTLIFIRDAGEKGT